MRVIWISIVLFAALVVAGIWLYEPDAGTAMPAAIEKSLNNPFAEEETASTDVELPALPQEPVAVAASNVAGSAVAGSTNAGAALVENSVASNEPVQGSVSENLSNKPVLSDQPDTPAVVGKVVSNAAEQDSNADPGNETTIGKTDGETEPPKLGLAMLELQKENNRNKIAVIVHADNPQELTAEEIKAMYMDRLTRWEDGSKVMLYNLPLGDKFREKFSKNILNMTALEADSAELQRRELKINANPVYVKAKNIVVSYVEQNPNAVAYVPLVMVREKSNVKVIMTIP